MAEYWGPVLPAPRTCGAGRGRETCPFPPRGQAGRGQPVSLQGVGLGRPTLRGPDHHPLSHRPPAGELLGVRGVRDSNTTLPLAKRLLCSRTASRPHQTRGGGRRALPPTRQTRLGW